MNVIVMNKDGKVNVFKEQKETILEDLVLAVTSGLGFSVTGPKGLIAYGPGTVHRVGFTVEEKIDE